MYTQKSDLGTEYRVKWRCFEQEIGYGRNSQLRIPKVAYDEEPGVRECKLER